MQQETKDPKASKEPQRGFDSHHGSPRTILVTLLVPQI